MENFTSLQIAENNRKKRDLFDLVASGEAFLMAGAGLSKLVGYPLWKELIQLLEKEAVQMETGFVCRSGEADEADIVYSSRLVDCLGKKFDDIINDVYGAETHCHPCHISLVRLPFKAILTTNYDRMLESALRRTNASTDKFEVLLDESYSGREVFKFLRSINTTVNRSPKVFHIHGECFHPPSIIFSAKHYEEKYGIEIVRKASDDGIRNIVDKQWTLHRKFIWAVMATRRIVYIGFSMSDEYFRIMHRIVSEDVRFYGTDTHFLIARIDKSENPEEVLKKSKRFKDEFGIETVFFPDDDNYRGLENFIFEMEEQLLPRKIETVHISLPNYANENEIPNKTLLELSRKNIEHED